MDIDDIRALIRANPRTAEGYPQRLRDLAAQYARRRRASGARWADIVAEVGISSTSLRGWMATSSAGFQQVAIIEEPTLVDVVAETFVVTSPSGFTLTGCTLEQAVAVMQRLR